VDLGGSTWIWDGLRGSGWVYVDLGGSRRAKCVLDGDVAPGLRISSVQIASGRLVTRQVILNLGRVAITR